CQPSWRPPLRWAVVRPSPRHVVVGALIVGGAAHFVVPDLYARIVPKALGHAHAWVYASGVVEVAAGGLLGARRTRRLGGWLSAAVLLVIFPANVQHALDSGGLLWVRLPLQVPSIWWALREARRPDPADQVPVENRATSWTSSSAGPDGTV
ncbi:MAG: DoxX family protein, partial [Acidimicrobiales bacterium]